MCQVGGLERIGHHYRFEQRAVRRTKAVRAVPQQALFRPRVIFVTTAD
jgi:hypothetical protein